MPDGDAGLLQNIGANLTAEGKISQNYVTVYYKQYTKAEPMPTIILNIIKISMLDYMKTNFPYIPLF